MGRYWNEVAGPRWVARQAVQEARNAEMLALLLAAAKAAPGERVLDIGCGTGVTTLPLAEAVGPDGHVTGVDISQPMLDAARARLAASSSCFAPNSNLWHPRRRRQWGTLRFYPCDATEAATGAVESRRTNSGSIRISPSSTGGRPDCGISQSQMMWPIRSRGICTVVSAG